MVPAKPAGTFFFVSQLAAPYFEIEPPPRTLDTDILGPLELSTAEREWINAVLDAIMAINWPGGWIRSDEIGRLESIVESVIHVHIRDDRLRENFPRMQWRRGLRFEQPLVHMLCRRAETEERQTTSPSGL